MTNLINKISLLRVNIKKKKKKPGRQNYDKQKLLHTTECAEGDAPDSFVV